MVLTRELIRDGWIQQLVTSSDEPVRVAQRGRAAPLARGHARRPPRRPGSGGLRLRLPDLEPVLPLRPARDRPRPRLSPPVLPVDPSRPRHARASRPDAGAGHAAAPAVACSTRSPPPTSPASSTSSGGARWSPRPTGPPGSWRAPQAGPRRAITFLINHAPRPLCRPARRGGDRRRHRHRPRAAGRLRRLSLQHHGPPRRARHRRPLAAPTERASSAQVRSEQPRSTA